MNLNNIYQQMPAVNYRTTSNSTTNNNQPLVTQMKSNNPIQNQTSSLADADKVIFKIESDHFSNGSNNNFKLINNYTNQLINTSSSNGQDLKQFKVINNGNNLPSSTLNNGGLVQNQLQQQQIKQENKANNLALKSEANVPAVTVTAPINDKNGDSTALSIYVNNVVCSYSTRCHLNLRRIAMEGLHVEYKKENGMVNMKLRKPYTTATMWSSGKVTCAGAKSEADAYIAARRFCRMLQKMQFKVKMTNYRVVNVLATCNMPFGVDIQKLAENYPKECSYEPELHPGATFKLPKIKATLKLFTTGSITLTSPSVSIAQEAINQIYPILFQFKRNLSTDEPISTQTVKTEYGINQQQTIQQQKNYQQNFNNVTTIKNEPGLKPPTQTTISNFNFYNNQQSNLKSVPKSIGTTNIIPINSLNNSNASENHSNNTNQITHLNNLNHNNSSFNVVKSPINSIQKANQLINSSNQMYQLNLPQTYHQIIPSNSLYSNVSNINNSNSLYVPSLTSSTSGQASSTIHSNQSTSISNQSLTSNIHQNSFSLSNHSSSNSNIQSIINSNSFSTNLGGSSLTQPSNGWYYDSLLVDNVDDFLP